MDAASRFPSDQGLELNPTPAPEMYEVQLPSATAGEAIPATSRATIVAVTLFLILISRLLTSIESGVTEARNDSSPAVAPTTDMALPGTALPGYSCDPHHV